MKLADIARLAQGATGASPIGIAAEAVVLLGRVADTVEKIAEHLAREDLPVCTSCETVGTLLCSEHGPDGYRQHG